MNYRRKLVVAGLVVLASGCAGSSRELSGSSGSAPAKMAKNTATDSEDKMVCETERTVGTWIPETVCRHVEQTERNRRQTQDMLNTTQGPGRQLGASGN